MAFDELKEKLKDHQNVKNIEIKTYTDQIEEYKNNLTNL